MKMGVESCVIPDGVDHHDHPEDVVIEIQHRAEEHPQALVGAVARLDKELPDVFEIAAKLLRDAECGCISRFGAMGVDVYLPKSLGLKKLRGTIQE